QQHQQHLSAVFRDFPDDEQTLREQELAWFRYRLTPQGEHQPPRAGETVAQLLATGRLQAEPIVYEDFLPVSAAGIFQSNLGNQTQARSAGNASRADFEAALGAAVQDEMVLYQQTQQRSLARCGVQE
ncbi:DUF1338 family protein, partial [Pantoea sp. R102]